MKVNEFTDFDNQENVPNVDTLELTLFDVESKSSQIWSKLRRNVRAHKFRLKMCGASQYKPNRSKFTSRTFDRGGVCGSMSNVDRTRTHAAVSAVAAAEQQPEGWRFVLDTILPGYQWAPQWVPARTPTVHWGPISGKAVGGPNTVQHSSTVQKHGKHGSGAMKRCAKSLMIVGLMRVEPAIVLTR